MEVLVVCGIYKGSMVLYGITGKGMCYKVVPEGTVAVAGKAVPEGMVGMVDMAGKVVPEGMVAVADMAAAEGMVGTAVPEDKVDTADMADMAATDALVDKEA